MSEIHRFDELLASQHGVALRRQANDVGVDRKRVARRIAHGQLVAEGPNILRSTSAPLTLQARLVAAQLEAGPDACLAFATAAAHWQLPGFRHEPVLLLRPAGRRVRTLRFGSVRACARLAPHHVLEVDGLRVTSPTRTLFDLALDVGPARVERALDTAWSMRLTDGPRLVAMLEDVRRSGRPGIETMDRLITERGIDWVPPESGIERRFHDLLRRNGHPPMRLQVGVGDDAFIGRVDALDDDSRVIAEIQSDRYHRSPSDVAADRRRRASLEAAGWAVVEIWEHELFHDPGRKLAELQRVRTARRGLGTA